MKASTPQHKAKHNNIVKSIKTIQLPIMSGMEIPYVAPIRSLGNCLNTLDLLKSSKERLRTPAFDMSSYHVEPHGVSRLHAERDVYKESTDTPRMATQQTTVTIKLGNR
ncbi:hypothetical protein C5F50_01160 [Nitrosopumilus ureiphilus]|uniref:Uncharacterized protein n=1 Tax=Nitrosopumilus ureiphilus TaxID=1470067 RepID=A0A7D5RA89_9ARCH|nr:hypothetical protein C5F50_01160 [Nitrosopumilus ureiphilus]